MEEPERQEHAAPPFGGLLRRHRLAARLTQAALAERAGLSVRGICDLERGARTTPQRQTVGRLARALGLGPAAAAALESAVTRARATSRVGGREPQQDWGPGRPESSVRGGLPRPPSSFIGRAAEVVAVRQLLVRPDVRLLTLLGHGGVGKTRLALEAAAGLGDAFAHGVVFVPLAGATDAAGVVRALAQTVGVPQGGERPLRDILVDLWRDKQLLLVLDNFEQVVDAAPMLTQFLGSCGRLTVLVTSRAVLHVSGEYVFDVPPLRMPDIVHLPPLTHLARFDAVRLFVDRATAARADFTLTDENATAVAAICHRLDGLPLALELAAVWVRTVPPQELLARLERRLPLLVGGPRDLPERQQTLRRTIAWSYDLLTPEEQALFRQLSVFAGGCTIAAAEAVTEPAAGPRGGPDTLGGLASLVDKSLLRQEVSQGGGARFVLLETIREFAQEHLDAAGKAQAHEVRRRHAAYYAAFAERAQPELVGRAQLVWFAEVDREYGNLHAALEWCLARGLQSDTEATELGLRLAGALGYWYWHGRGRRLEGLDWLNRLLALPAPAGATAGRGAALLAHAFLATVRFDGTIPTPDAADSVAICLATGQTRAAGVAMVILGHAAADPVRQRLRFKRALAHFRQAGDTWGTGLALRFLAAHARDAGNALRAHVLDERALAAFRQAGDRWFGGATLRELGRAAAARGDLVTARALAEEALVLQDELGHKHGLATTLTYLAWGLAQHGNDSAGALARYAAAAALYLQVGSRSDLAYVLTAVAELLAVAGRADRALAVAAAVAALWEGSSARPPGAGDVAARLERIKVLGRRRLPPDTAAAAWGAGQTMTPEQVITHAIER